VVVVVDASAIVQLLIRGRGASLVEEFIAERVTFAPTLLDVEVLNSIARMERNHEMSTALASEAAATLAGAKIVRVPSDRLTSAAWTLRHNIAIADAFYVALAVLLRATVLTADARLSRAPKLPVPVTLLPT
jgi:predicted nucleic acid-binding protein